jgi:hypothetical protein
MELDRQPFKEKKMKQFKEGDTIVYIPMHAKGNRNYPDCEHGFVTHVSKIIGTVYCKFYNRDGTLRTKANSEGCNPDDLVLE